MEPEELLCDSAGIPVRVWSQFSCHLCSMPEVSDTQSHTQTKRHREHIDWMSSYVYDYLGHSQVQKIKAEIEAEERTQFDSSVHAAQGIWRNRFIGWKEAGKANKESHRHYKVLKRDPTTGKADDADLRNGGHPTAAPYWCHSCDTKVYDGPAIEEHINSKNHKKSRWRLNENKASAASGGGSSSDMSVADAAFIRHAARGPGPSTSTPTFTTTLPSFVEFLRSGPDDVNLPKHQRDEVQNLLELIPEISDLAHRSAVYSFIFTLENMNVSEKEQDAYRFWRQHLPSALRMAFLGTQDPDPDKLLRDPDEHEFYHMLRFSRNVKHAAEENVHEEALEEAALLTGMSIQQMQIKYKAVPALSVACLVRAYPNLHADLVRCMEEAKFWASAQDDRLDTRLLAGALLTPSSKIKGRPKADLLHLAIASLRAGLVEKMLRDGGWKWSDKTRDGKDAWTRAHYWFTDSAHLGMGWVLGEENRRNLQKVREVLSEYWEMDNSSSGPALKRAKIMGGT